MDAYVAGRDCAKRYDKTRLGGADAARLAKYPQLAQRDDWRVSRFLKQQQTDNGKPCSLSHSGGVALWVCGGKAVGADIEYLRPRDFSVWYGSGVIHAHEQAWLAQQEDALTAHYAVWTLKEALIKALAWDFADLAAVGLRHVCGQWGLHGGGQVWQGGVWCLSADYVAACVWRGVDSEMRWHGYGEWQGLTAQRLWYWDKV